MKKIAIILGILLFAQVAAFAGGTVLYSETETIQQPVEEVPVADKGKKEAKVRVGRQKNDPQTYWNFGRVNFGSGFSSEGNSTRRF